MTPALPTKKRILIVDDDLDASCLLRQRLERSGMFAVVVETDPTAAVRTARWFRPDLILLDVVMPGMDGGDVAQALQVEPGLRASVVFMTSIISSEEAERGPIGGFSYLAKPVSVRTVEQCLSRRPTPLGVEWPPRLGTPRPIPG